MSDMAKKEDRMIFRLSPELRAALQAFTKRYERSESEVTREALWLFLESKGYGRKTQKGGTRKK